MKNYKEIHHKIGEDKNGKRIWTDPKYKRTVNMDQVYSDILNNQFENTGIRYELEEEKKESKKKDK